MPPTDHPLRVRSCKFCKCRACSFCASMPVASGGLKKSKSKLVEASGTAGSTATIAKKPKKVLGKGKGKGKGKRKKMNR